MFQSSFLTSDSSVWSVSDLTHYLRSLFEADYRLQDLWVQGEVSNVSRPTSGHLYFTLKDAGATLRCVMWRGQVAQQRSLPQDGQSYEVHGHISLYEAGGQYQLYADRLRQAGEGELYQAFLDLKNRLEAEGLFAPERKRELPARPRRIGIVSSPTGAALQDALDVLRRRYPLAEVVLAPSPVQGEAAPAGLIEALSALQAIDIDVILLVRGGGSIEDLAAFNDEGLARAVAASKVPVVAGVGHETDFTIADFVADRRAPTPTAAAEIAVPDRRMLLAEVAALAGVLADGLAVELDDRRWRLTTLANRLQAASPRAQLANNRQQVDGLEGRLRASLVSGLRLQRSRLDGLASTLGAVGPPAVLARGYAVVRDAAGQIVRTSRQVTAGDQLDIRLADGHVEAEATMVEPDAS